MLASDLIAWSGSLTRSSYSVDEGRFIMYWNISWRFVLSKCFPVNTVQFIWLRQSQCSSSYMCGRRVIENRLRMSLMDTFVCYCSWSVLATYTDNNWVDTAYLCRFERFSAL